MKQTERRIVALESMGGTLVKTTRGIAFGMAQEDEDEQFFVFQNELSPCIWPSVCLLTYPLSTAQQNDLKL